MTSAPFKLLFSPIKVGRLTLRNRIVFLPHGNNYAEGGLPGDREAYYFAERAKGGVALIIWGGQMVHPPGSTGQTNASALDPRVVGRYHRVTDRVHRHGACIAAQLVHVGSRGRNFSEGGLDWSISRIIFGDVTLDTRDCTTCYLSKAVAPAVFSFFV